LPLAASVRISSKCADSRNGATSTSSRAAPCPCGDAS
jgi:hypothetical protein